MHIFTETFVTGFKNWYSQAGKIISSTISKYDYELIKGNFKLRTKYEKTETIDEELALIYKTNSFFITFIGTK